MFTGQMHKTKIMLAKEGYSNIAVTLIIVGLLCFGASKATGWLAVLLFVAAGLLLAFILYFFRDPDRDTPTELNTIIAPADGKILSIKEIEESLYIKGPAIQISIFLSPLDVHVNRVPASGKLEYVKYNPGVFLMAWNEKASTLNERADFGMIHYSGIKIFFRQITGFMARRIVYHIKEGDALRAGERFGMMKFGSRMDVVLPSHIKLEVKEGQRTVGGETVLAHINST